MKRTTLLLTTALFTSSLLAAAPKEEIQAAAKKLADSGYSWKTTTENAGGGAGGGGGARGRGGAGGVTEGKADKNGVVLITMTAGQNTTEAVLKGDKGAVKTPDGWQSLAEVAAARRGDGGGNAGARRGGRGANFRNFKAPAAQAEDLLGKLKDLKSADGAYSGDLTEEGAKSMLTGGGGRGGANAPEVSGAKGSVKFWIKDGVLSKYQTKVQGTITANGTDRQVDRTTTIEIKDVGTTKVEVPEDAKKKLS
jgi:hypothetical protein